MSRHSTPGRNYISCDRCGAESTKNYLFDGGANVTLTISTSWGDSMSWPACGTNHASWDLCPNCRAIVESAIATALKGGGQS